jgi:hypothetical protein
MPISPSTTTHACCLLPAACLTVAFCFQMIAPPEATPSPSPGGRFATDRLISGEASHVCLQIPHRLAPQTGNDPIEPSCQAVSCPRNLDFNHRSRRREIRATRRLVRNGLGPSRHHCCNGPCPPLISRLSSLSRSPSRFDRMRNDKLTRRTDVLVALPGPDQRRRDGIRDV